ncbi:MAG: hypothetical protein IJP35_00175 [Clostridia bacterium]|nr:hypothetical protein [Clostridia bacterium]
MDNNQNHVNNQQPVYVSQPSQYNLQTPTSQTALPAGSSLLVFGILSLVFSILSMIPYFILFGFGIAGIVFGLVGLRGKKKYTQAGVLLTGTAKVGAILSKAGFIVGIVITSFWTVYLSILAVIGLFSLAASYMNL